MALKNAASQVRSTKSQFAPSVSDFCSILGYALITSYFHCSIPNAANQQIAGCAGDMCAGLSTHLTFFSHKRTIQHY